MKTKLLKRIRKQYSIVYYPNGFEPSKVFRVPNYAVYYVSNKSRGSIKNSKNECLEWIMDKVRDEYKKYSKHYNKNKYKGVKVWCNY